MAVDGPGISSTAPGGAGVPVSQTPPREDAPALTEKPKRQVRNAFDPFDLNAALARLAGLLSLDADVPRRNVPRSFYLDFLV